MKKDINVEALARVEGEGGLLIKVKDDRVDEIQLKIYEPPRFFEGFLRGRYLDEVPDMTARICGICPVAYQMSAVRALEDALDLQVSDAIRSLRRLFYCAEYIESHALHMYMLQAPDLLGHTSGLSLATEAPELVQNALRLKKIGNGLLSSIGGRSVHPVNTCVGGFYSWPPAERMKAQIEDFEWAHEFCKETVRWAATLPYPELEVEYEFVAQHHPEEYAFLEGDVLNSAGEILPEDQFAQVYLEQQVGHSTSLHSHTPEGRPYLVGPLARFNLNFEQLSPAAREVAEAVGLRPPLHNPYRSLLARAVELVEVTGEALRRLRDYRPTGPSRMPFELHPGAGAAVSEAPRGLLYHAYEIDGKGMIQSAHIMPPTAQNLARIEADLWQLSPAILAKEHEEATLLCEKLIRAYDPCISCSVHFLDLRIEREFSEPQSDPS